MSESDGAALADFLLARIADDEAVALEGSVQRWPEAAELTWDADFPDEVAAHMLRFSPQRILAECRVKRRLVAVLSAPSSGDAGAELALRLLALPYAAHPGYRDEWRP